MPVCSHPAWPADCSRLKPTVVATSQGSQVSKLQPPLANRRPLAATAAHFIMRTFHITTTPFWRDSIPICRSRRAAEELPVIRSNAGRRLLNYAGRFLVPYLMNHRIY